MGEDIEFEMHAPDDIPVNGHWRGLTEVSAAVRSNFGALAEQEAELDSVVAQGDTVMLLARERGRVRATGGRYHLRWVQVFTFRADKIVRVRGVAAHLPDSGA